MTVETRPCGTCGRPTTGTVGDAPLCLRCYVGPAKVALWRELRRQGKSEEPDGTPVMLSDAELFDDGSVPGAGPGWQVKWNELPFPAPMRGDLVLVKWKDGGIGLFDAVDYMDEIWWGRPGLNSTPPHKPGAAWESYVLAWAWIKKGN